MSETEKNVATCLRTRWMEEYRAVNRNEIYEEVILSLCEYSKQMDEEFR